MPVRTDGGFGIVLTLLALAVIGAGVFLAYDRYYLFDGKERWPIQVDKYVIENSGAPQALPAFPPLPDISGFTAGAVEQGKPEIKAGNVVVRPMVQTPGFDKFLEARRATEFSKLQDRRVPLAVHVLSGVYDLPGLVKAVNDPQILSRDGNVYTLRLPLYVEAGATLIIAGPPSPDGAYEGRREPQPLQTLRLSQGRGAFILASGTLFITDTEIAGWNEKKDDYSRYESATKFRPFVALWSGSRSYFSRSKFMHLGYHASKSYGISYSTTKNFVKANPEIPPPKGWIVQCWIEGVYYGFYSYEAEHVALVNNIYTGNIVYAIDPHDRSRHLIIAGNETYGTLKKHGIIGSREVNDSWIFNNVSHDNHGSGFMLDRTSVRNVVANNVAHSNGSDGITLFESENNFVWGNRVYRNKKGGLRIRNSWNIVAADNFIALNGGPAVELYSQNLFAYEKDRDFVEDPFTQRASLVYDGGIFAFNNGGFKAGNFESLTIQNVDSIWYRPNYMRGAFSRFSREIAAGVASGAAITIKLAGGRTQETTRKPLPEGYISPHEDEDE